MAATKISGFGYAGFSDLEDVWDDLPVSRLKYNVLDDFQEVFQTASRKSSGLPGSRLDFPEVVWTSRKSFDGVFSHVSPFHNKSERFGKFLIRWFSSSTHLKVFNQMVLIFHSFKDFSDLEDFWDDLPVSRLKYNALDDFQEVFQTTSRKSSDEVFFHIKWSSSLSL
ncbi:hypothetical protein DY000_02018220 [Brassica cretica]|uniref:Uncharacterized protein n=1 Tax=Brassica cretica TaxID=69181 RepID=A0ABQ7CSZ4_BRACR|nr:hypothetical protein DY000_02018220 [Brassica cretica]